MNRTANLSPFAKLLSHPLSVFIAVLLGLPHVALPNSQAADLGLLNYDSNIAAYQRGGGYTIGSKFTIGSTPVTINSLGAQYLSGPTSIPVGLWNADGTQLIASATAQTSDTLYAGYYYANLGQDFILAANTTYNLGAYISGSQTFWDGNATAPNNFNSQPFSGNPSANVTITSAVYGLGGSLAFPGNADIPQLDGRWGPANAAYITPVPEPTICIMALTGLASVGYVARRRCRRA